MIDSNKHTNFNVISMSFYIDNTDYTIVWYTIKFVNYFWLAKTVLIRQIMTKSTSDQNGNNCYSVCFSAGAMIKLMLPPPVELERKGKA